MGKEEGIVSQIVYYLLRNNTLICTVQFLLDVGGHHQLLNSPLGRIVTLVLLFHQTQHPNLCLKKLDVLGHRQEHFPGGHPVLTWDQLFKLLCFVADLPPPLPRCHALYRHRKTFRIHIAPNVEKLRLCRRKHWLLVRFRHCNKIDLQVVRMHDRENHASIVVDINGIGGCWHDLIAAAETSSD